MLEKSEEFDLQTPPGDRWIFVKPGKNEAEETNQGSLPQNWLEEPGGSIMTGNESGQWFTLDKKTGCFNQITATLGEFVEQLWWGVKQNRERSRKLFQTG